MISLLPVRVSVRLCVCALIQRVARILFILIPLQENENQDMTTVTERYTLFIESASLVYYLSVK